MFSGNTARLPLSSSPPTASFSLRGSGIDWPEGATVERSGLPLYQGSPLTIPRFGSTSETSRTGAPSLPSWRRRTGSGGAFSTLCAGDAMTSSEAAEILAETVYAVSQAVRSDRRREPVRNLDSYLYHSFVHRFTRFVGREERIQYVESAELLDFLGASPQQAWVNALENEILLKQILGAMDPKTRQMLTLRNAGHSWQEVGRQFGISTHNAEVQFWYGVKKAKGLLGVGDEPKKPRRRKK